MSFDIKLYQNTEARNKVTKNISGGSNFNGTLRTDSDITTPTIMLEADASDVCGYNYAYIPAFKRYYYIKNVNAYRSGLCIVSMTVDVLKTFSQAILNSSCIITRSGKSADAIYSLPDDSYPIKQSETTHVIAYPELYSNTDPAKAQSLILVMTGINPKT